ncbi:unnamed protein product [Blumeria hordei]|uniref:Membrane insertase YidC/Oxa/ALB C-terminal domain-containing protein n=1 Tax=Blumeria hordei TaxID=2867405 RepID=A0A383UJQ0_BLUHO|nr:unnamed protein product [Blumeria hordei]
MISRRGLARPQSILAKARWCSEPLAAKRQFSLKPPRPQKRTLPLTNLLQRTSRPRPLAQGDLAHLAVGRHERRYASTGPPPSAAAADAATAAHISEATRFDEALELSAQTLINSPEHIGYLKAMGLDWGWGPTSVMEYGLEHLHVYMGGPWWLSIAAAAVLTRAVLFMPYVSAADNAARLAVVSPMTKPIMTKMVAAQKAGDQIAFLQYKQEQTLIHRRAGIKAWKAGIPLIQMVLGFGTFRLLNGMAKLPVPGLETGGALWFANLAAPDPLYLLPMATAATLHWVLRKGGESGVQMMNAKMLSIMKWGFPLLSLVFTSWLPAAVQLHFFASGLLSLAQSTLLRQPAFRTAMSMTPLPKPISAASAAADTGPSSKIRMIKSPVLSQTELHERFQPAPTVATAAHPPPRRCRRLLKETLTDIRSTVQEVVEAGRGLMGQTKQEVQDRLAKAEKRQRDMYEAKRQAADLQARVAQQQQRRESRALRKAARSPHQS